MYLMFVDESGDCGITNSPTRYFILTGLVIHELRWKDCLIRLQGFRGRMRLSHGLKLREAIHAVNLISRRPRELARIPKYARLAIIRNLINEVSQMADVRIISVVVDKQGKGPNYDVFNKAWTALIQRFENTIRHRNFPGPPNPDERGMIFPDRTDEKKLMTLLRRVRKYNPVPSMKGIAQGYRQLAIEMIIGDPAFTDSSHSYFIQTVDVIAYCLLQQLQPNSYMRGRGGKNFFAVLQPVLCRVASPGDPQGVVRL